MTTKYLQRRAGEAEEEEDDEEENEDDGCMHAFIEVLNCHCR